MINIQIVSDIHAEFWSSKAKFNFIKPSAPILALLGDICCCGSDDDFAIFKRFILELLPDYEHIMLVSGNHEYYYKPYKKSLPLTNDHTIDGIDEKIKAFFKATSNKLHYLNNSSIKLQSGKSTYLIVGSTLWSWIPEDQRAAVQNIMNDYNYVYVADNKKIRNITTNDVANRHMKNYKYIKSQISKAKKAGYKVVVLTHHKPTHSDTFAQNLLNVAYESDLSSIIKDPIILWAYGHTHKKNDSLVNGVRLYSNPKGYPSQRTGYDKSAVVKV